MRNVLRHLARCAAIGLLSGTVAGFALADTVSIEPKLSSNCTSACHSSPFGAGPGQTVHQFGTDTDVGGVTSFRAFLVARGTTMAGVPGGITDPDLDEIRVYFREIRAAAVLLNGGPYVPDTDTQSFAFPTSVYGGEQSTDADALTVTVQNLRASMISVTSNMPAQFAVTNNCGGLSGATSSGASLTVQSCILTVKFAPGSGPAATVHSDLVLTMGFAGGDMPTTHSQTIHLTGTSNGPRAPNYQPSGFGALTSLIAPPDGSTTSCPSIANAGSAALVFSVSDRKPANVGTDYTSYFEIGPVSACTRGGVTPAACVAASASVQGSATLAAGQSCTLPIVFNPGQFAPNGDASARSVELVVTHNDASQTSPVVYAMTGSIANAPAIGTSTSPEADPNSGKTYPLPFRAQVINTASAPWSDFLVYNVGTADGLDITQITNSNPGEFALQEDCVAASPLAIMANGQPHCTITLTFTPTALLERCTTITIRAAHSGNGAISRAICGTGIPVPTPQMGVTPGSLPFGTRSIGAIYLPLQVVIANAAAATADLDIASTTLIGDGFSAQPSCAGVLHAGQSCTIDVQFAPATPQVGATYNAVLRIVGNDPTTPQLDVPLSAIATAAALPVLSWSSTSGQLAFGNAVAAGTLSAEVLTAALVNNGPGAADLQTLHLVGANASSFKLTSCQTTTLYESQTCNVTIQFNPDSGGTKTAAFEVVTNGVAPPPLSVTGQAVGGGAPRLTLSVSSIDFGAVTLGSQSAPAQIRLASAGDGVLRINGIAVDAPYTVKSTTCPAPPFTLQQGSECSIAVTFAPTAAQAASGTMRVSTDADTQSIDVALKGEGQDRDDLSSGGCSISSGKSMLDPTLWAMAALAAVILVRRRRADRTRARAGRP